MELFRLKYISMIFLVILKISCTKDETEVTPNYKTIHNDSTYTIINKNEYSDNNLTLKAKKLFTIKGNDLFLKDSTQIFTTPLTLDIDDEGNIFILDVVKASISKFNENGKFIKNFGHQGIGPGEMRYPNALSILGDTVYVSDPSSKRMVKFSTDGEFRSNLLLKDNRTPQLLKSVDKDKFIGFIFKFKETSKGLETNFDLALMDSFFSTISYIRKFKVIIDPKKLNILDFLTPYAVGREEIFVAENSSELYKINVFDFKGKLKYSFSRYYRKIRMSKVELENFNKAMRKANGGEQPDSKVKYKKSINNIFYDEKNDYVIVNFSIERKGENEKDFIVDIFKDGILLNSVNLNFLKGADYFNIDQQIYFKKGRIFVLSIQESKVDVYSYKFQPNLAK